MKLVKDDHVDTVQCGVADQHACQDAFGEHLDTGGRRDTGLEPDAVADGLSHFLAKHLRHAFCHLSCSKTARFEHQDATGGVTLPDKGRKHSQR